MFVYDLLARFLEGRTNCVLRAGRKAGTYRDGACVTVAFSIVIDAVVDVAMNALDVLLAVSGFTVFVLLVHLLKFSF